MSVHQKQLLGKIKKTGQEICLYVHYEHEALAHEDWKGFFDDLISSIQFFSKRTESIPRRIDIFCGSTYEIMLKDSSSQKTGEQNYGLANNLLTIIDTNASFADLIVAEHIKEQLNEIIFYCINKEVVDREMVRQNSKAPGIFINFYGPSGTGKTLTAEIIAANLGKKLMIVNYANLESELVGRTSKNIHTIFEIARQQDNLLMFDEADSFLSARITELRQSADYGINTNRSQLLKELEHYPGTVIFATNNIDNYDYAFQRRFQYNIYFPLPDFQARHQILQLQCFSKKVSPSVDWNEIAEKLEGFSGGDIHNVVRRAIVRGMQEISAGQAAAIQQRHFLYGIECVEKSRTAFRKKTKIPFGLPLAQMPSASVVENTATGVMVARLDRPDSAAPAAAATCSVSVNGSSELVK